MLLHLSFSLNHALTADNTPRPLPVNLPARIPTSQISNRQRHPIPPFHYPNYHTSIVKQLLLGEDALLQQRQEQFDGEAAGVDGIEEMQDGRVGVGKGAYRAWIKNYSIVVEVNGECRGNVLEFIESERICHERAY